MRHITFLVLLTVSVFSKAGVLTLQDGLNGNFSTEDTYIKASSSANTNFGTSNRLVADGGGIQALITFTDLFGTGSNQLQSGASITQATLTLHVTDTSTVNPTVHQMLVDWSENQLTWNNAASLVGGNGTAGIQNDGVDAKVGSIGEIAAGTLGDQLLDITSVVQNWSNGEANFGLLIQSSSSNAAEFASSQEDFHVRPRLTIEYAQPVPTSGTAWLLALAMAFLFTTRTKLCLISGLRFSSASGTYN